VGQARREQNFVNLPSHLAMLLLHDVNETNFQSSRDFDTTVAKLNVYSTTNVNPPWPPHSDRFAE
jgi:hypothetical protein